MVPGGVVTFLPSSHIQSKFIGNPSTLGYKPGQEMSVKYFGRDPVTGQLQVSKKALSIPPLSIISEFQSQKNKLVEKTKRTTSTRTLPARSVRKVRRGSVQKRRQWWEDPSIE